MGICPVGIGGCSSTTVEHKTALNVSEERKGTVQRKERTIPLTQFKD